MTTAERIEARGEARGRAEILILVMTEKFGPLPTAITDRVRTADLADLRRWTSRVLKAETVDEVFAE
ncbi:transposase [Nocardia cyriacigeorgica]|uniref:transposase n=1 Tax=Nocardia cyriacigeorgica TaxID=135487 RepID=UPI001893C9A5|nr:transposase [Nocardia cyriacigeorgica]MBF6455149.1 transposase [Nocardia cyriacigeorgica]MBF6479976.1 transposase [Nocardia cyriacigeorgica]MBF6554109.1 transposase [Nocardia cyriacigeorgica]